MFSSLTTASIFLLRYSHSLNHNAYSLVWLADYSALWSIMSFAFTSDIVLSHSQEPLPVSRYTIYLFFSSYANSLFKILQDIS